MHTLKFIYLIAAYNEEGTIPVMVDKLKVIPEKYPGSIAVVVDNGSQDNSRQLLLEYQRQYPWLVPYFTTDKGMGVAYRKGLTELLKEPLTKDHWIIMTAADLPFEYTDVDSFLPLNKEREKSLLFIGSKAHPKSQVARGFKRRFATWVFQILRRLILNMKTGDPQGTLFLRGDQLQVVHRTQAHDYFITTEIVYFLEKMAPVVEMPVVLNPELRSSKVRLIRDGMSAIKQLLRLRVRAANTNPRL